ncbi:MAG: LLM class F420-dependent oxidoreductase [Myxococcota bacterium]|nr:LLM class F420-dependent oxidoreductase [Myxococcales bacterium]
MHVGVTIHATDQTMDPVEVAVEAEARGFHSFYVPEHTHIPASRRTPAPTGDAELAVEYYRTLDPYIVIAAAGARTRHIRLGTGIGLVAQHDHLTFAKQLATLDRVTQGRLVLGIGFGWNHEEMENHGIDVKRRRELVREKMLAMRELWTKEVAAYHGDLVRFEPSYAWPKPVQQPGPRTLIGGAPGPKLFAQIAEYADGWMPIGGAGMAAALEDLRKRFDANGRDPAAMHVVPFGVLPSDEKLAYYRELGVTEAVLRLPAAGRDAVLAALDSFVPFAERFADR